MTELAGAKFAEAFYREAVRPLLARDFPRLPYLAARLGSGSDVIGLDDSRSQDHDWGCRLTLLLDDTALAGPVSETLERELPETFLGKAVRFPVTWNPHHVHQVEIASVTDFAVSRLGLIPQTSLDWLCLTGHSVLETIGGPVFHDDTASFSRLRQTLSWYPEEVFKFVLAATWRKATQSLAFVGRTADTGQELQSRLVAGHLVTDLIRQAFLLEKRWIPYPKWTEAVFHTLPLAAPLMPHLDQAISGKTWQERESGLAEAIEILVRKQRDLGLPTPAQAIGPFFDRPYRLVNEELATMLVDSIADPLLKGMALIGSIEQWVDNADILAKPDHRPAVLETYRALIASPPETA